jgi:hypothetical protein
MSVHARVLVSAAGHHAPIETARREGLVIRLKKPVTLARARTYAR